MKIKIKRANKCAREYPSFHWYIIIIMLYFLYSGSKTLTF